MLIHTHNYAMSICMYIYMFVCVCVLVVVFARNEFLGLLHRTLFPASRPKGGDLLEAEGETRLQEFTSFKGPKRSCKHKDPANHDFWYLPSIGPWNQNVRSLRLGGLLGP